MTPERARTYLERFFAGATHLEGQPIDEIHTGTNESGTWVTLVSHCPHVYHLTLVFPPGWDPPTLISAEDWQKLGEVFRDDDPQTGK